MIYMRTEEYLHILKRPRAVRCSDWSVRWELIHCIRVRLIPLCLWYYSERWRSGTKALTFPPSLSPHTTTTHTHTYIMASVCFHRYVCLLTTCTSRFIKCACRSQTKNRCEACNVFKMTLSILTHLNKTSIIFQIIASIFH